MGDIKSVLLSLYNHHRRNVNFMMSLNVAELNDSFDSFDLREVDLCAFSCSWNFPLKNFK